MVDDIADIDEHRGRLADIDELKHRLFQHLIDVLAQGSSEDSDRIRLFVDQEFGEVIRRALDDRGFTKESLEQLTSDTARSLELTSSFPKAVTARIRNLEEAIGAQTRYLRQLGDLPAATGSKARGSSGEPPGQERIEDSDRPPEIVGEHRRADNLFGRGFSFLRKRPDLIFLYFVMALLALISSFFASVLITGENPLSAIFGEESYQTSTEPRRPEKRDQKEQAEKEAETPNTKTIDPEFEADGIEGGDQGFHPEPPAPPAILNPQEPQVMSTGSQEICESGLANLNKKCQQSLVEQFRLVAPVILLEVVERGKNNLSACKFLVPVSNGVPPETLQENCIRRVSIFGEASIRQHPVIFLQVALVMISQSGPKDGSCLNLEFGIDNVDGHLGDTTLETLQDVMKCIRDDRMPENESGRLLVERLYERIADLFGEIQREIASGSLENIPDSLRINPVSNILLDELTLGAAYHSLGSFFDASEQ